MKLNLDECAVCRVQIKTGAFRGTGACGDDHRKLIFGKTSTTIILTDEKLAVRDEMIRAARKKYRRRKVIN